MQTKNTPSAPCQVGRGDNYLQIAANSIEHPSSIVLTTTATIATDCGQVVCARTVSSDSGIRRAHPLDPLQ